MDPDTGPKPAHITVPVVLNSGSDGDAASVLRSHWAGGQTLAVYGAAAKPSCEPTHSMSDLSLSTVCEVAWAGSNWNKVTRRFVNQTHEYFMSLQMLSQQNEELDPSDIIKYSRLYRSALHESVLGFRKMADSEHPQLDDDELRMEIGLFSSLELSWHLVEVLFVEVLPAGCLIQQLLEWTRWHSDERTNNLVAEILAAPSPGDQPKFWPCLYRLVLMGRLREAAELLAHHSIAQTHPRVYSSAAELLRKAPMVMSTASLSRAELHRRWTDWQNQCSARLSSGEFFCDKQLELLVKVLAGEEKVFEINSVASCCDRWYELMVAKLLFCSPLVTSSDYDLIYAAEHAINVLDREKTPFDELLLAALRNDILEFIKLGSTLFSSWWFVAHLSNLLDHIRLLPASNLEQGSSLSEFFLLEYASSLMNHTSLWTVAMGYLSKCLTQGHSYMETYIERVPVDSERKAMKVFRLCEKYQLKDQGQSVCRVMAMKACRSGRLGVALSWCIRGKESAFAAFLAEKYLDNYKLEGEFMDLDLLDHLGSAILINERLMFLAKYREYHQLYEAGDLVPAGKLLVSLLLSNTVPTRFWPTLLTDALLLMEADEVVFSTEQTYALSHLVQQLSIADSNPGQSESVPVGIATETFSLLHLALARNLSRSFLNEQSI